MSGLHREIGGESPSAVGVVGLDWRGFLVNSDFDLFKPAAELTVAEAFNVD